MNFHGRSELFRLKFESGRDKASNKLCLSEDWTSTLSDQIPLIQSVEVLIRLG